MTFRHALISLLVAHTALAFVVERDNKNPIQVKEAKLLGNQSSNIANVYRDMGYNWQIGNQNGRTYSDGQVCNDPANVKNCQGFAANSMAKSDMSDPTKLVDFGTSLKTICSPNAADAAAGNRLHPTSVISLSDTTGVLFYQNIDKNNTVNIDGNTVSSGVAIVTYDGTNPPSCDVKVSFWGANDPSWGDHDIVMGTLDGYLYAFGGPSSLMPLTGKLNSSNIFVTRVKKESVTDKTAYQYWDGANWNPTFTASPEAVVFSSGQGSLSYNNHYNTYFYLYPTGFPIPSMINVVVSPVPQGPWSDPVTIYNCTMGCYGPAAQPYFDPSGKTLILDVSIWAAQFYTQTASLTFN